LPCVLDGPINGESFKAYIDQFLVPTLKPGDFTPQDCANHIRNAGYAAT
jgi:hypothetical protein